LLANFVFLWGILHKNKCFSLHIKQYIEMYNKKKGYSQITISLYISIFFLAYTTIYKKVKIAMVHTIALNKISILTISKTVNILIDNALIVTVLLSL
jgi:hypothetical protein